jgi:hypothetical protein
MILFVYYVKLFRVFISSPDLKAQVSYSDRLLSVFRLSVCMSVCCMSVCLSVSLSVCKLIAPSPEIGIQK